ncbi:TauD/TfdA family dioxygenase [bacterium]|nr:TauD/TfdA family dioxygenase [bacterium]
MLSFAAQAGRYFDRPHEAIPAGPVGGPAAWRADELRARGDWLERLSADEVAEIERAASAAASRGLAPGLLRRKDFALPSLARRVRAWARELREGRGIVVLRGLPVERWGDELSALAYWGLGLHLGVPGAQNPVGDVLGHVVDTGEDADNPFVRRYRTAGDIAWHCDLADVVGLLCLRTAERGGASRVASSVAVHDELLRRRPDLARRLWEPVALDLRDETRAGTGWIQVVPCRHAEGRLRTFWHSDYFRSAQRHAGAPVGSVERELFDAFDGIASEPGFAFDMEFEQGDVQLVSNHVVVHARTAYEDAPGRERHLLRLWLTLDDPAAA